MRLRPKNQRRHKWLIGLVLGVLASMLAPALPVLADNAELNVNHPRASDAAKISLGNTHTCAILTDGSLWCWGSNTSGELGLGDTTHRSSPVRVGSANNWRQVSSGYVSTTCAVNTANEVFCWGYNASGQTGVSKTTAYVTTPTKVTALGTTVDSVSVGDTHVCVVTTSGIVKCWGSNSYGQLGTAITLGISQSTNTPTTINNLSGTYTAVAAGGYGTCAIKSDKKVWCWGHDLWGQRGDDTPRTADDAAPTQISSSANAAAIITSSTSNCFINEANDVTQCWGQNQDYFLRSVYGNINTSSLVDVAPFFANSTYVLARAFSVGSNYACMLKKTDGGIVCGGANGSNQISNVPGGTGYIAVGAGTSHVCAIKSDHRLVCWGHNYYGQTGNGTTTTPATAGVVTFGANAVQTLGLDPVAPSAPGSVTATVAYKALDVSWTTPSSIGTAYITNYEYRLSTNAGGSWGSWTSLATTGNSKRITGLTAGTAYLVQVRAVSPDGNSGGTGIASPVTPTAGCNVLKDCTVGAIGPNGGTIVIDSGPGTQWGRFIEAAPANWSGSATDPWNDWQQAMSAASNWKWGSELPSQSDLLRITNAYNADPVLLAGWGISDPDGYWSSTDPYEPPVDDGNGGYTYPTDEAYAGHNLQDKNFWNQIRPIIYMDGPAPLPAPTVTATAGELSLNVSWTTPSIGTGGAITDYQTRISDNAGSTWSSWTSRGVVNSLVIGGLVSAKSYRVEVRAVNFAGSGNSGQSSTYTMTPTLTPSSQTVNGTTGTTITATTAFTPFNFSGSVTYSVFSGSLPTGLSLAPSTGVISGTPSVTSSATVTIRGTGSTAGTANSTVTFAVADPAPNAVGGVWAVDGLNAVVLEWFAPMSGPAPTGYQYAYSTNSGVSYSAYTTVTSSITTSDTSGYTRVTTSVSTGLTRGTETVFKVRAMNGATAGPAFPDPADNVYWPTWSPKATAKISDPCDPMNDCDAGDVGPGGGIIVYDHGANASWGRYLEAAPAFWNGSTGDPLAVFGCSGSNVAAATGGAAQAIGAGPANATAVMTACATAGIAARLADAYTATVGAQSVSDWHLPSSGDLGKMYLYRQTLGGWKYSAWTDDETHYASSTDQNSSYFYGINGSHDKVAGAFVRPVRYVAGPNAPSEPRVIAGLANNRIDLVWGAPTNNGGNAVSGYEYRVSTDGGSSWATWTSVGLATSASLTPVTNNSNYVVQVRAINRGGAGSASSTGVLVPGPQSMSITAGSSVSPTSPFPATTPVSGTTYAVSAGALPAGLTLDPSTGVISGTPTTSGSGTVTMTATVGGATVTVTMSYVVAAAPTTTTVAVSSTTAPTQQNSSNTQGGTTTTTTTVVGGSPANTTTTTIAVKGSASSQTPTPTLNGQTYRPVSPGHALIVVNGMTVDAEILQATDSLRATRPSERTAAQVNELRQLADTMIGLVRDALGSGTQAPISIVRTPSGASLVGLLKDPVTGRSIRVPIEHVVLVHGGGIVLMVSGKKQNEPASVGPDGVLQISRGGSVSVLAYGLVAGTAGEVVVMSTPQRIDRFTVDSDGSASAHARFPSDLESGSHTVTVSVGDDSASLGFRITDGQSTTPMTGMPVRNLLLVSALLLLVGLGMLSNSGQKRFRNSSSAVAVRMSNPPRPNDPVRMSGVTAGDEKVAILTPTAEWKNLTSRRHKMFVHILWINLKTWDGSSKNWAPFSSFWH